VHHVAEALSALGGAFLICRVLARAGVPVGLPAIPLFVVAGVVLEPQPPDFGLVENPAADPPRARLAGTRRRRSPGREGTCRSPT
jgi:hypothetical protein